MAPKYKIRWQHSDKPNTYPWMVRVERDGVLVGCEGSRCEEEMADALYFAVRQARGYIRRMRKGE
jgi:hypothetical protein